VAALSQHINRDKYGIETESDFKLSAKWTEKIAQEFLARTKVYPTKHAHLHKITHLRSGVSDIKGKKRTERVLDAGVIYRRSRGRFDSKNRELWLF
jgi:hypothetical protein